MYSGYYPDCARLGIGQVKSYQAAHIRGTEAGVNVTVPLPTWLNVTVVPGMTAPPASLAVMVNVAGNKPVAGTVVVVDAMPAWNLRSAQDAM